MGLTDDNKEQYNTEDDYMLTDDNKEQYYAEDDYNDQGTQVPSSTTLEKYTSSENEKHEKNNIDKNSIAFEDNQSVSEAGIYSEIGKNTTIFHDNSIEDGQRESKEDSETHLNHTSSTNSYILLPKHETSNTIDNKTLITQVGDFSTPNESESAEESSSSSEDFKAISNSSLQEIESTPEKNTLSNGLISTDSKENLNTATISTKQTSQKSSSTLLMVIIMIAASLIILIGGIIFHFSKKKGFSKDQNCSCEATVDEENLKLNVSWR